MATSQSAPDAAMYAEQITEHITSNLLRVGLLAIALVGVLMDWVVVSIMGGGGQSAAGYTIISGKFYLATLVALALVELVFVPILADSETPAKTVSTFRRMAWVGLGALLSVIGVGSLVYINAEIETMMAELGFFAGAVDASIGLGLYLAIIMALGITAVGAVDY